MAGSFPNGVQKPRMTTGWPRPIGASTGATSVSNSKRQRIAGAGVMLYRCRMWGEQSCAAIALSIAVALSMSACAVVEAVEPPPVKTAFSPSPAPPPPAPTQRLTPPQPGNTRAEMVSWLSVTGYRDFQVAALVQLADTESGFRPCVVGPGGYHYLFQCGGTRLRQLREFVQTSGCPQLRMQLAFADNVLRNYPRFSCFWGATAQPAAYVALRRIFGRGSC